MMMFVFFILALAAVSPAAGQDPELQHSNCPMFWSSFNGRCYKYVATQMTWVDAELHCVSQRSNLVSVHSLEEHNFVNFLIKNFDPAQRFTWIGLTDLYKEGAWMWSDGSKVNFQHWDQGQPDNRNKVEHCVHTNMVTNHKWNDHQCSETFPFVCAFLLICPSPSNTESF
ncbi:galactose-specific lectin nattectin-like [Kryptolebias marmoratus]|uniref:galactose-specific lectin nattectin-like n=1 Tax=Kryptolebias marmoratus TaxID=37003 RepID=UPI000D530421|nr:galactose-specific lectin nattectin-like [Kryptolebias marmoratus]